MASLIPTTPIDRAELQRVARQLPTNHIEGVDKPYDFGHQVRRVLFDFDALEAENTRRRQAMELEGVALSCLDEECTLPEGHEGGHFETAVVRTIYQLELARERIAALEAENGRIKAVAIKLAKALKEAGWCVKVDGTGSSLICDWEFCPRCQALAAWEALGAHEEQEEA